ncbi:MAG: 3,4-dihydroxy-9,10-secoandrosta-1,3,5(10)-triene-9,17-dione 4,5-dioxygenase [Halieaceae bacterium]|jgi:3,4-dihydroxy-9,10-secoandrosta-1,3,5(10)-triene-9,17-dione 4,5-dioxygenase
MIKLNNLGYIILTMEDPASWKHFGTQVLGMMDVPGNGAALFLKVDQAPHRIIIQSGEEDRYTASGWEVADKAAMSQVAQQLRQAGREVVDGDAEGAALRAVTGYVSSSDTAGNSLEIFFGRLPDSTVFASAVGVNKFITADMGLGHIVLPAPNIDETHDFYVEALGFGDSDDLSLPPPAEGAPGMRIRFMHANNPRHHSLALFNFPSPVGLVHLMVEVDSLDQVGLALDRVKAAGIPLMASLGRHCNDNMLSFYVTGPGGIVIEYGYDGLQVDWDTFAPTQSTEGDIWGHHYNAPAK